MAEIKTPLAVFQVDMTCDKCGEGRMRSTGITLTSYPPQYPHRCNKCDAHKNYDVCYPKTLFEEIKP